MALSLNAETLKTLKILQLKSKKKFLTNRYGRHKSLKRGHGFDFAEHGTYQPGADIRYIDWNIYARTDNLYVKRFTEDEDLRVVTLIDNSASMDFDQKWETSAKLSIALAHISIMQGERFYSSSPTPFTSQNQLKNLPKVLLSQKNVRIEEYFEKILKFPGVVFYFSDFLYELSEVEKKLNLFIAKNMDVVFVQVLSDLELNLNNISANSELVDLENKDSVRINFDKKTKENYHKLLVSHQSKINRLCTKKQVSFVTINSSDSLTNILQNNFLAKGLLEC